MVYEITKPHWSAGSQGCLCPICFDVIASDTPDPNDDGWVYFIRGGDFVKIGHSKDPVSRLARLATGSPFPLELWCQTRGGLRAERALHKQFAEDRASGEWFHISDALRSYVERLAA